MLGCDSGKNAWRSQALILSVSRENFRPSPPNIDVQADTVVRVTACTLFLSTPFLHIQVCDKFPKNTVVGVVVWQKKGEAEETSDVKDLVPVTGGQLHVLRFFDPVTGHTLGPNAYARDILQQGSFAMNVHVGECQRL